MISCMCVFTSLPLQGTLPSGLFAGGEWGGGQGTGWYSLLRGSGLLPSVKMAPAARSSCCHGNPVITAQ